MDNFSKEEALKRSIQGYLDVARNFYANSDIGDKEFRDFRVTEGLELFNLAIPHYQKVFGSDILPEKLLEALKSFINDHSTIEALRGIRGAIGNGSRHEAYVAFQSAGHFRHANYHNVRHAYIAVSAMVVIADCIAHDYGYHIGSASNAAPSYISAVDSIREILGMEDLGVNN
jgi:hypothetical protein